MVTRKNFSDSVQDSVRYLIKNTDITYFSDGSIAKALVETNNLEVSRVQQYITGVFQNAFLSSTTGIYLDMWGETLGLPRIKDRRATTLIQDGAVRFFVANGTLGSRLPNPGNSGLGLLPFGIVITNAAGTVEFTVTEEVTFPVNARSVFVPVTAQSSGTGYNVGANQLTLHNLNKPEVKVTNDIAIVTGADVESDEEYRFRLTRAMTSRYGSNLAAVEVAAMTSPGVARAELVQYARGAGTFDVLLVPQGNRVTLTTKESTRRAIEQVAAYGVSFEVREPEYVPIRITLQTMFSPGTTEAERINLRAQVQSSILRYIADIPLGGELVINQLRAASLVNPSVKDIKIIELYIDCKPRTLRNVQLREDELFIPDEKTEAIEIV
tara:strand:+ start:95237 stop:96382 length:1146 start_codon:yes stop_codon:yes gene_type:complete